MLSAGASWPVLPTTLAGTPATVACAGTGAMEAAVVNVVPPGGKAIVLNAGHFAARWAAICKAYGIVAVTVDTDWGQPVDPARVAEALKIPPPERSFVIYVDRKPSFEFFCNRVPSFQDTGRPPF